VPFVIFAHDAPLVLARGEPLANRIAVQSGACEAWWMQAQEQTRTMPPQDLSGAFQPVGLGSFDIDLDEGRHEPAQPVPQRHQFLETLHVPDRLCGSSKDGGRMRIMR
jgi:hypothetical protein